MKPIVFPRYFQRTSRLTAFIASCLHNSQSIKETARQTNVSTATVGRILDTISYSRRNLVDPIKHNVLDILPDRKHNHLASYFLSIPKDERHRVNFFVCDMWRPYVEMAYTYFPNAEVIIDKYHFTRQTTWAIEGVRKRLQKTMPANLMLLYNDDLRRAH